MGVTYRTSITPSLSSSSNVPDTSETIFAGSSEVFGGSDPLLISLSTKWAKLRGETRRTARDGWIVGSAGVSPGSTLNNATFLDPARDKQFRLSVVFARGTEFLVISLNYSTSIDILIDVIGGYLMSVISFGRTVLRIVEAIRHTRFEAPTVVKETLGRVSSSYGSKPDLAASSTLGHDHAAEPVELDPVPHITKVSNYDVN